MVVDIFLSATIGEMLCWWEFGWGMVDVVEYFYYVSFDMISDIFCNIALTIKLNTDYEMMLKGKTILDGL